VLAPAILTYKDPLVAHFTIEEAWMWRVADYHAAFALRTRLSPADMRLGISLVNPNEGQE
jgi:hypothetical protein